MGLDPELQIFLQQLSAQDVVPIYKMSPEEARTARTHALEAAQEKQSKRSVGNVEDRIVLKAGVRIPVRIYTPSTRSPRGVLVYFHGGGWVLGDLETVDDTCRALCEMAEFTVVSAQYRLAPEHKFPQPVNDAESVLQWVIDNVSELGSPAHNVVVGGDSAGGNLAAAVAHIERDKGIDLLGQILIYPITNYDFRTKSYQTNASGYYLEKQGMEWFWSHYLRTPADGLNPLASVLLAENLHHLAKAFVLTAEYDPLRDEGILYADKLRSAGVSVRHVHKDTAIHGFFTNHWGGQLREDSLQEAANCLVEWSSA